jgi:hypothetical protein
MQTCFVRERECRFIRDVFYVVTAVYRFHFRLVINETPKTGYLWHDHAVMETHVFAKISVFPPIVVVSVPGLYDRGTCRFS